MLRETIIQMSKAAEARKPALLAKIAEDALTAVAESPATEAFNDEAVSRFAAETSAPSATNRYLEMGKSYGPAIGYGAGAGAIAGIPTALLARALFSDDDDDAGLSSYLMTALKGGLIGGGLGGLAGGGLRGAYGTEGGKKVINRGLDSLPEAASTRVRGVLA